MLAGHFATLKMARLRGKDNIVFVMYKDKLSLNYSESYTESPIVLSTISQVRAIWALR